MTRRAMTPRPISKMGYKHDKQIGIIKNDKSVSGFWVVTHSTTLADTPESREKKKSRNQKPETKRKTKTKQNKTTTNKTTTKQNKHYYLGGIANDVYSSFISGFKTEVEKDAVS